MQYSGAEMHGKSWFQTELFKSHFDSPRSSLRQDMEPQFPHLQRATKGSLWGLSGPMCVRGIRIDTDSEMRPDPGRAHWQHIM